MKAGNLYPIAQEILSRLPAEDRQLIRLWHMGFKCTYLALLNHRTVESVRDVVSSFLTKMSNSSGCIRESEPGVPAVQQLQERMVA